MDLRAAATGGIGTINPGPEGRALWELFSTHVSSDGGIVGWCLGKVLPAGELDGWIRHACNCGVERMLEIARSILFVIMGALGSSIPAAVWVWEGVCVYGVF